MLFLWFEGVGLWHGFSLDLAATLWSFDVVPFDWGNWAIVSSSTASSSWPQNSWRVVLHLTQLHLAVSCDWCALVRHQGVSEWTRLITSMVWVWLPHEMSWASQVSDYSNPVYLEHLAGSRWGLYWIYSSHLHHLCPLRQSDVQMLYCYSCRHSCGTVTQGYQYCLDWV